MSANEKLTDLLLRKDILSRVLVHLIDSGLHECRRVCRRWYEVCSKLPVKLSRNPRDDRYVESDLFPNAIVGFVDGQRVNDEGVWITKTVMTSDCSDLYALNVTVAKIFLWRCDCLAAEGGHALRGR